MSGNEARSFIIENGVLLWRVAELWGVTDSNFSRRLRKPFEGDDLSKLKRIVSLLKADGN